MPLFALPQVVPNLYKFLYVSSQIVGPHWLPQYGEKNNGSQWGPTVWLPIFFKISSFVIHRRKKCIQVWNNLRVS